MVVLHGDGGNLSSYCTESPKQVLVDFNATSEHKGKAETKAECSSAIWHVQFIILKDIKYRLRGFCCRPGNPAL